MAPHDVPPDAATADFAAAERRAEVDRQVDDERVATLYALTPTPLIAGLAFAVLVAVILWPYRPGAMVASWLVAKFVIGALRLRDVIRFTHSHAGHAETPLWRRRAVSMLVLDGICWGAMGVLFMPEQAPGVQAVILASLIGIAGAGVFSFISDARGCVMFLWMLLLPTVVYQLLRGSDAGLFAGLGTLVYLGLMWLEAHRGEQRICEMLRLRFENGLIAEERRRALLLAQHSSAAKSRFLATVSHEMRTPLNGILGMTQLLQRSGVSREQMAQLETIRGSSQHLQTVIGDLLDLSRIEFGKLALDERPLALEETVHEVTDLLHAVAQDKGLAFRVGFEPGLPMHVLGDAARIRQVLHNLIGNAIKFTPRGLVGLRVEQREGRLCFEVRDSGQGVAPEVLARIFDAFEQGPAATVCTRSGTGLGLTISRQIARAMGGDVECETTSGIGACFVFTLPLRPAAPALPTATAETTGTPALRGRVLVVDDHPVNAMVAQAMLERMGLHTELADDGEKALALMREGRHDLVLMDCQLPVMDGWEATRRWRLEERGARLPIVALTANAVVGDRERCLQAGMDDYLAKPFQMEELAHIVARNLAGAR
ncbi:MAG TPA: response regulator [Albitalea sp.]|uniref:response regulator n=1 Tax=Piscinibacter sp. TaxID=1903157 RepID=UPI002ED4D189